MFTLKTCWPSLQPRPTQEKKGMLAVLNSSQSMIPLIQTSCSIVCCLLHKHMYQIRWLYQCSIAIPITFLHEASCSSFLIVIASESVWTVPPFILWNDWPTNVFKGGTSALVQKISGFFWPAPLHKIFLLYHWTWCGPPRGLERGLHASDVAKHTPG